MNPKIKDIKGYEGLYKVHCYGFIYSVPRKGTKGGFMKIIPDEYPEIVLTKRGQSRRFLIHRIVAEHFIENPNNYPQINHINGNKYDNYFENLEWCNNSMNTKHSYDNGLTKKRYREANPNHKLTSKQVIEIYNIAKLGGRHYGRKKLAEKYGVSECTIKEIVTNRYNKLTNVSKNYCNK